MRVTNFVIQKLESGLEWALLLQYSFPANRKYIYSCIGQLYSSIFDECVTRTRCFGQIRIRIVKDYILTDYPCIFTEMRQKIKYAKTFDSRHTLSRQKQKHNIGSVYSIRIRVFGRIRSEHQDSKFLKNRTFLRVGSGSRLILSGSTTLLYETKYSSDEGHTRGKGWGLSVVFYSNCIILEMTWSTGWYQRISWRPAVCKLFLL